MKKLLFVVTAFIFGLGYSPMIAGNSLETIKVKENIVKEEIKVYGNCGMCKSRIEKAVMAKKGVVNADWDSKTKILTVNYDKDVISIDDIHKAIAAVGHDTDKLKATDKTYNKLHPCCKYRKD